MQQFVCKWLSLPHLAQNLIFWLLIVLSRSILSRIYEYGFLQFDGEGVRFGVGDLPGDGVG